MHSKESKAKSRVGKASPDKVNTAKTNAAASGAGHAATAAPALTAAAATASANSKTAVQHHLSPSQVPWRLVFPMDVQLLSFLFLVSACVFSNGIPGELTFDDHLAIEKNADAWADKTVLWDIFFDDFWGKKLDRLESNGSYRPLTVLTFRIQHWLMGYRHSPVFLHCFNYMVAFGNVCLVYYLARLYVYVVVPAASLSLEQATVPGFSTVVTSPLHAVPLVAGLLYLVHPVHVDAVTSIVGRCELLYCFFGLLGFFCVHRFLNQVDEQTGKRSMHGPVPTNSSDAGKADSKVLAEQRQRPSHAAGRTFTYRYLVFSAYALLISILCKDSAVTFTALYGVHAGVMYACGRCSSKRTCLVVAAAVVELVAYLSFRRNFIGNVDLVKSPLLRRTENPQYFVPKGLFHWLSIRWVIQVKNLELLFFPTSLCCEYSFNCIPHLETLQDPRVPYFAAVTATALLVVLGCLYGTVVRHSKAALVGLLSFFWVSIPYAPVSHLFIAVGTFIAERCLYVPSIGAVLFLTYLVASPGLRRGVVPRYFFLLLILALGWAVMSHRRNNDWLTDERLFRAAVRTCPQSGKAHAQLAALVSGREGRVTPELVKLARNSVMHDPQLTDGFFYLAVHEVNDKHNIQQAYLYLRRCVNDTFALHACRETYNKVRQAIFPAMTEVEALVDTAALTPLSSQRARLLRQASIYALQKEHLPCKAESFLEEALTRWNASQLFWIADEVSREVGESTYCNAVYWYVQSTVMCEDEHATKATKAAEEAGEEKPVTLTAAAAAHKAVMLADRLRPCGTDWRTIFAQPSYMEGTYPFRISQFLTLSESTVAALERYLSFTHVDTTERNAALLALLDVRLREYCHISTLLNDQAVRDRVAVSLKQELRALQQNSVTFRQRLLPQLREVRRELKLSSSLNATQAQALREVMGLAACSDDLAFLSAQ